MKQDSEAREASIVKSLITQAQIKCNSSGQTANYSSC